MLLSETERTALCLWSSTLQCAFTSLNLHHLGEVNNGNEGVNCLRCSHRRGLKPKSSLSAPRRRILVWFWKVRFRWRDSKTCCHLAQTFYDSADSEWEAKFVDSCQRRGWIFCFRCCPTVSLHYEISLWCQSTKKQANKNSSVSIIVSGAVWSSFSNYLSSWWLFSI